MEEDVTYHTNVEFNGTGDPEVVGFPRLVVGNIQSVGVVCTHTTGNTDSETSTKEEDKNDPLPRGQAERHNAGNRQDNNNDVGCGVNCTAS